MPRKLAKRFMLVQTSMLAMQENQNTLLKIEIKRNEYLELSQKQRYKRALSLINVPKDSECKIGCNRCCALDPIVTSYELKRMLTEAKKTGCEFTLDEWKRLDEMTDEQRFYSKSMCPFLADDKCSVYDVRPITCRMLYSRKAETCETPQSEYFFFYDLHVEISGYLSSFMFDEHIEGVGSLSRMMVDRLK